MEDDLEPVEPFWRALLFNRQEAQWGNFSWVSTKVLLDSGNDQIAKGLDTTIVNRRRMRWMAAQRDRGVKTTHPIRLCADKKKILVLGDPGEMDASQYVLLRELIAADPDALLLMSDIVYPAGDWNSWRDAVYLPYFGLPRWAWDRAKAQWKAANGGGEPTAMEHPAWDVFATPGNHDWYDGLRGFMFHMCDTEPLPNISYSKEGLTFKQRISRVLWRSGGHPKREVLDQLRADARAGLGPDGPRPALAQVPGPYYALDVGAIRNGSGASAPALRIVCVDNGIDGSIDVEQARWLAGVLCDPDAPLTPKVVVTGKPLFVGNEIARFTVDRGAPDPVLDFEDQSDRPDLLALVSRGDRVIATVAGDIHCGQRMVLRDHSVEPATGGDPSGYGRIKVDPIGGTQEKLELDFALGEGPAVQFVSGGGGAYLTETHSVKVEETGDLILERESEDQKGEALPGPNELTLPSSHHMLYPARADSVRLFAHNVTATASAAILAVVGLALAGALWLLHDLANAARPVVDEAGEKVETWRVVAGAFSAIALVAALPLAFGAVRTKWRSLQEGKRRTPNDPATDSPAVLPKPPPGWRKTIAWATLGLIVVAVFASVWSEPLGAGIVLLAATALALVVPLLLLLPPILRAYPRLARVFPFRLLAGAILVGVTASSPSQWPTLAVIGALTGIGLGYVLAAPFARKLKKAIQEAGIKEKRKVARGVVVALTPWPLYALAGVAALLGSWLKEPTAEAIQLIVVVDALLLLVGLALILGWILVKACRTMPEWLAVVVLVAAAGGFFFANGLFSGWEAGPTDIAGLELDGLITGVAWIANLLTGALAGTLIAVGLAFGLLKLTNAGLPAASQIERALPQEGRRSRERRPERNLSLFRAMAVAGMPKISEIAEATQPPFFKNFLMVDVLEPDDGHDAKVRFELYGVQDERGFGAEGHPGREPVGSDAGESAELEVAKGSYLVDRVEISVGVPPG